MVTTRIAPFARLFSGGGKSMRLTVSAILLATVFMSSGCGSSSGSSSQQANSAADSTANTETNNPPSNNANGLRAVPPAENDGQGQPSPAQGQTRAGTIYDITIPSPFDDGGTIAATIFEPTTMTGGETYPLVLYGSGFGGTRETSFASTDPQAVAFKQLVDLQQLTNAGYGILSFDHLGHGDTIDGDATGRIRVMDPDFEGAALIRIVDWAEVNLDWLAYGANVEGTETDNLILGSVGASYGGGYQLLLHTVDPKKRLDAIVPLLTWNDLRYSLAQQNVIKEGWVKVLADGKDDVFDPFFLEQLDLLFATNTTNDEILDTLRYHGAGYFCDGDSVMHNAGGVPLRESTTPPPVNALFAQSSRDILFNFNEAVRSYECYRQLGGDARLYSVQIGHNTIGTLTTVGLANAPTDPGAQYQIGDPFMLSATCAGENMMQATLGFFNEHLKGQTGASAVAQPICLDLANNDSILVDDITRGGRDFIIENAVTLDQNLINVQQDESATRTTVPLFTVTAVPGEIIAGIPQLTVTLTDEDNPNNTDTTDTIIFAAIGHMRTTTPGIWDIIDNQLTPLRGLGDHQIDMVGVLERLNTNDQIGLMLFGTNDNQYLTTGSRNGTDFAARVRVTGTVSLPILATRPPDSRP